MSVCACVCVHVYVFVWIYCHSNTEQVNILGHSLNKYTDKHTLASLFYLLAFIVIRLSCKNHIAVPCAKELAVWKDALMGRDRGMMNNCNTVHSIIAACPCKIFGGLV